MIPTEVYRRFKDETLWNYEVGVKSSYERVTLNGSLFYADIDNLARERGCRRMFIACGHQRARGPYHGRGTGVRPFTPRMPCW